MPALPLEEAGKYVAAAYVVFFTLIVVYVAIMAAKISRIDSELSDLVELTERDDAASGGGSKAQSSTARDGEAVA